ncbi:hypothetical protein AB5I41_11195 [Sphingomonas sp. MMS24-JH45]
MIVEPWNTTQEASSAPMGVGLAAGVTLGVVLLIAGFVVLAGSASRRSTPAFCCCGISSIDTPQEGALPALAVGAACDADRLGVAGGGDDGAGGRAAGGGGDRPRHLLPVARQSADCDQPRRHAPRHRDGGAAAPGGRALPPR